MFFYDSMHEIPIFHGTPGVNGVFGVDRRPVTHFLSTQFIQHKELTMYMKLYRLAKRAAKRILGMPNTDAQIKKLFDENDFLDAYSQHTDLRVEMDPYSAVGGMWEEIGKLQFQFLSDKGLRPHHRMLDIGCGTLRGGRHFINYLKPGNYYGIDISQKAIEYGHDLIRKERLSDKTPKLFVSEKKDLKFKEFSGETFDFILAQSVFSHLKPEHIQECFENIGHIMNDDSVFYFTFNLGDNFKQRDLKDFSYPFSFFESLASKYGFRLRDCATEYNHPRQQVMIELKRIS